MIATLLSDEMSAGNRPDIVVQALPATGAGTAANWRTWVSSSTFTPTYRQKRRHLNRPIELDMASSTAQRRIVAYGVAQIPASGLIAQRSRQKYGPRRGDDA